MEIIEIYRKAIIQIKEFEQRLIAFKKGEVNISNAVNIEETAKEIKQAAILLNKK